MWGSITGKAKVAITNTAIMLNSLGLLVDILWSIEVPPACMSLLSSTQFAI